MARRKTKYTLRKDGTIELVKKINGKRKHFYGHSDAEVEAKYAEALKAAQKASEARTFEEVANDWWAKKEPQLSPNSVRGYVARKTAVVSELGNYPIDEITPFIIVTYLRKVAARDYSQKVIADRKSVIKSILDEALIAGEISSNPCIGLPVIKGKPGVVREPATDEEIESIEASKTESMYARMSYFMLYTGCRRGEAAALQQKHIDRANGKARICQTLAFRTNSPEIKPSPKTKAGLRDVDLYDNVLEILPEYDDPETFVFFPDGLPTEKQLETGLKKYQKSINIESTAHALRHNYASMLHSAEVDVKDAQVLMGHSSVLVTQDIYTSIESKHKASVRDKVNDYIKNK